MTTGVDNSHFRPRLLFVCHANQCRSPAAELLAAAAAQRDGLGIEVRSAGTQASDGLTIHPKTDAALQRRGISTEGWRSRRLRTQDVEWADLILTADTDQLRALARLVPASMARTFTMLQFAGLSHVIDSLSAPTSTQFAEVLHESVAAARSQLPPLGDIDIADPVRDRGRRFERCMTAVEGAVNDALSVFPRDADKLVNAG